MAQKNDVGTSLIVTVTESGSARDISAATTKEIILLSPSGTSAKKTAAFVTDGSDGKIKYVTQTSDLAAAGTWKVQAHIVVGSADFHTERGSFSVGENIEYT